jgi:NitT/TauT family transport system substrate-binding protein
MGREIMEGNIRKIGNLLTIAAFFALPLFATSASAETRVVRLAKQYGISYLPLAVIEDKGLIESEGKKLGLDLKTEWARFTGGPPMNEALISGNLDFASGGSGPLITAWARTRDNIKIKGICALNSMPQWLNTTNPKVKTIRDFTEKDRIALPAVRIALQAIILQMAAEKEWGQGEAHRLDKWTVSLSHPDGLAQLLGGKTGITAHFTSAPFMYKELEDKRVHRVLDSYDVFGGPHTFIVVWAAAKLYEGEPKVVQAFLAAVRDAEKFINDDPAAAAAIWVKVNNSKISVAEVEKIIRDKSNVWTMTPQKLTTIAQYMGRSGMIPTTPTSWKEIFIDAINNLPGD